MKIIYFIVLTLLFFSCGDPKVEFTPDELEWINASYINDNVYIYVNSNKKTRTYETYVYNLEYKKETKSFPNPPEIQPRATIAKLNIKEKITDKSIPYLYYYINIVYYKTHGMKLRIKISEPTNSVRGFDFDPFNLEKSYPSNSPFVIVEDTTIENYNYKKVIKYKKGINEIYMFNKTDGLIQFTELDTLWTLKK